MIRKTVGGPKRFRPLTREEMENKIMDLEKRVARGGGRGGGSVSGGPSIASQARSISGARDALTNIAGRQGINVNSGGPETNGGGNGEGGGDGGLSKIAQLMEEINGLRSALDVSEGNCELQKEEVARLRKRNSDLAADVEEINFLKMQVRDVEASKIDLLEEMTLVQRKMTEVAEENAVLKTNSHTELEQAQAELDALQMHCEKLLTQNASLLKKLGEMEEELDNAHHSSGMANVASKQAYAGSSAAAAQAQELEKKLARANDKLKQSEQLIVSLQQDNSQILNLKSQLREKNNQIKEQSKALADYGSRDNSISPVRGVGVIGGAIGGGGSPNYTGTGPNSGPTKGRPGPLSLSTESAGGFLSSSLDKDQSEVASQLKSKLKDTEAENARLGQALTAAQRKLDLLQKTSPQKHGAEAAAGDDEDGPVSPRDKDMSKIKGLQKKLREANDEIDHLNGIIDGHQAKEDERAALQSNLKQTELALKVALEDLAASKKALKKEKRKSSGSTSPRSGRSSPNPATKATDDGGYATIPQAAAKIHEVVSLLFKHYFTILEVALDEDNVKKLTRRAPVPRVLATAAENALQLIVTMKEPEEDQEMEKMAYHVYQALTSDLATLVTLVGDVSAAEMK